MSMSMMSWVDEPEIDLAGALVTAGTSNGGVAASSSSSVPGDTYWRQRFDQISIECNRQMVRASNLNITIDQLKKRLQEAERKASDLREVDSSLRYYQQKAVDALDSTEPLKKQLIEAQAQLLAEVRERAKFQCEAEGLKASTVQMQAFVGKHEEQVDRVRTQYEQTQTRLAEKSAEVKRLLAKTSSLDTKYKKAKEELKAKTEECKSKDAEIAKLRKMVERAGVSVGMRSSGRQRNRMVGGPAPRAFDYEEESESDDLEEELLRRMADTPAVASSPTSHAASSSSLPSPVPASAPPTSSPPDHQAADIADHSVPTETHSSVLRIAHRPPPPDNKAAESPRTKAIAVLERKERQEAAGTYTGGAKRMFCRPPTSDLRTTVGPPPRMPPPPMMVDPVEAVASSPSTSQAASSLPSPVPTPAPPPTSSPPPDHQEQQPSSGLRIAHRPPPPPDNKVVDHASPRTKAMTVLERKERQEAAGTYAGGAKRMFCRPPTTTATIDLRTTTGPPPRMPLPPMIDPVEAVRRMTSALADVLKPPLSPIPQLQVPPVHAQPAPLATNSSILLTTDSKSLAIAEHVPLAIDPQPSISPTIDSQSVISPTIDSQSSISPTIDPQSSISPTIDPQSAISPTIDPQSAISPTIDPQLAISPTIDSQSSIPPSIDPQSSIPPSIDSQSSVSPTIGRQSSIPLTIDRQSSIPLTIDPQSSISPTTDSQLSISPTIDPQPSISPTIDPQSSISPTIDRQSSISPTIDRQSSVPLTTDSKSSSSISEEVPLTIDRQSSIPLTIIDAETSSSIPLTIDTESSPSSDRRSKRRHMTSPSPSSPKPPSKRRKPGETTSVLVEGSSCKPPGKVPKENRSCAAVLDALLTGPGTSHMTALEKWMCKASSATCSAETAAASLLEAVKRHNALPWVATQFKTVAAGLRRTCSQYQALSANDKKLSDLVTCLMEKNPGDWASVPHAMIDQAVRQLAMAGPETGPLQVEALCRWAFHWCRLRSTPAKALQVLLAVLRPDRAGSDRHRYKQTVLYGGFLTLALVWPAAFDQLVLQGDHHDDDLARIVRTVFRSLLDASPVKAKASGLLDRCLGRQWADYDPTPFDQLVRQQLGAVYFCSSGQWIGASCGLRPPDDLISAANNLCLMAPFLDQGLGFLQASIDSVVDWPQIGPDDRQARGGVGKLMADLFLLARLAPHAITDLLARRADPVLDSLRTLLVLDKAGGGTEDDDLLYLALDLVSTMTLLLLGPGEAKARHLLSELADLINKREEGTKKKPAKQWYLTRAAQACKRVNTNS